LDLAAFRLPNKAREGVAGRDATDPPLWVSLWLYACVRGIGAARELARQCSKGTVLRAKTGDIFGVQTGHLVTMTLCRYGF
jgi:hypothetical protein